jgi:hypothetical protein
MGEVKSLASLLFMAHYLVSSIDEVHEDNTRTLPENAVAAGAQITVRKRNCLGSKREHSFALECSALKHKRSIEFCINQAHTVLQFQLRHSDQNQQRPLQRAKCRSLISSSDEAANLAR